MAGAKRVAWVDVGKGVSILGVVLFHVIFLGNISGTHANAISVRLDEVRMSLFFILSGMFAHKISTMTVPELFRRRVWAWGAPYVLWCIPAYIIFGHSGNRAQEHSLLHYIVFPENGMWFLYALTTYAVLAYIARKMPGIVVMWLSVALSVLGALTMPYGDNWGVMRVFMFAPFFFGGLYARDFLLSLTLEKKSWQWWATGVALSAVFMWMSIKGKAIIFGSFVPLDSPDYNSRLEAWRLTMALNIGYVGSLGAAIIGSIALSMIPVVREVLMFFGKRTLPLYLVNEMVVATWYAFVERRYSDSPLVQWLFAHPEVRVWTVFSLVIAIGLALHYVSKIPYVGKAIIPQPLPPFPWEKNTAPGKHRKRTGGERCSEKTASTKPGLQPTVHD